MSAACIFCRIVAGDAPANLVYQDDAVTAFRDIRPQAPVHLLIIPNQHLPSLNDARQADPALLGRLLQVAAELAASEGVADSGYRLVTNTGPDAAQSVHHLHFHLLGGSRLRPALG